MRQSIVVSVAGFLFALAGGVAACAGLPAAPSVPSAPTVPNAASLTSGDGGSVMPHAPADPLGGK